MVEALQEGGGVCDRVLAAGRDDGEIAMLAEHMLCRLCDEAEEVVREVRHDNAEDLGLPCDHGGGEIIWYIGQLAGSLFDTPAAFLR